MTTTADAVADPIIVRAGRFELRLGTDAAGRLVQTHLGSPGGPDDAKPAPFHPPFGSGYVWEPAVAAVHADGNTSTDLLVVGHSAEPVGDDVVETRIELKDPAYPFTVTLVFHAFPDEAVIQQWAEVRHAEPGPVVVVSRFASSALTIPDGSASPDPLPRQVGRRDEPGRGSRSRPARS